MPCQSGRSEEVSPRSGTGSRAGHSLSWSSRLKPYVSQPGPRDLEVQVKTCSPLPLQQPPGQDVKGTYRGLGPRHHENLPKVGALGLTLAQRVGDAPRCGEAHFLGPVLQKWPGTQISSGRADQKVSLPPLSVSSVPSDREQAPLEKTNIYSSNESWHKLFPVTGVWLAPWDGHNRRHSRRQAHVPLDTSIQAETMSSRWRQHVPRSHPTHSPHAHRHCGMLSARALLDSPMRKFIFMLALCSLLWPLL